MKAPYFYSFIIFWLLGITACQNTPHHQPAKTPNPKLQNLLARAASTADTDESLQRTFAALTLAKSRNDSRAIAKVFDVKFKALAAKSPEMTLPVLRDYTTHAVKSNDTVNLSAAYFNIAQWYQNQDKQDSAFHYYERSRQLSERIGDSAAVAYKLILIGNIYMQYNDYIELENVSTEVFRYIKSPPATATDSAYAVCAYSNCGLAYLNMYDYDASLTAFARAKSLSKDPLYKAIVDNNMGYALMEKKDFNRAIGVLSPWITNDVITGNPEMNARILDNLGYSIFKVGGKTAESGDMLLRSATLRDSIGDDFGAIPSYIHLSEFYNGDNSRAKRYALQAYKLATKLHSADDRIFALKRLRECVAGQERDHYSSVMINLKDSITRVRQVAKNQFAKIRYDSSQADAENLKLKTESSQKALELEKRGRWNDLLLFGIVVVILLSITIYSLTKKRLTHEKMQEGYRTENRIAKKLHDELANDMYNVIAFAESQDLSDTAKRESLLNSLDDVYSRTRDISRENHQIDTGANFSALLREMLSDYGRPGLNIILQGLDEVDWDILPEMKKLAVWRVLQELMVNMKKHSRATLTAIRFSEDGKKVRIDYSDNGVGISPEKIALKNGLRNVENRIEAIGGTITFDSVPDRGLKIAINVPA